jgi:photosystem II stability/assembly factor-like uncharacterized protein
MSARPLRTWLTTILAIVGLGLFNVLLLAQEPTFREEVRPDEMADLVATALTPANLYPLLGETVDVAAGVRNRATHAEPRVMVSLYAGSAMVASQTIDFTTGETRTLHFSWQPKEEGAITLTLRIDADHTRGGMERRGDQMSVDVVAARQPTAEADFAVSNLEFSIVQGQPSLLRATVQNNGKLAGSAPLVLQVDGQAAARQLVALSAGGKKTVEVPWSSEEFRGQLSAEINPRFRDNEKKTDDNVLSRDLRPPVGLLVEGLSMSAAQFDPKRPRQVTISFRIVNTGRTAITETFRTAIFPGAIRTGNAQPLDTYYLTTNGLAPGSSIYVSRTIISPTGEFDVRVEADADHKINLTNRTSNLATAKFKNPTPSPGRWVSIGPTLINNTFNPPKSNGRVTAIAIDPTSPSTIYVGAAGSGVWKTSDGGASWAPIADSLPSPDVAAIAVDPTTGSRVYVALAGTGVFGSADGGTSWTQLSSDLQAEIRWGVMLVNPTTPSVIYVSSLAGVYRSPDSGGSWALSKSGGEVTDLVMDPTNPNILYAAISGDGLYKTTTGGAGGNGDWTKLAGLPSGDVSQITLALCRGTPSTLYTGYSRTSGFQLYGTKDGGASWSLLTTAPFVGLFNDTIGVDSGDPNTVYITGVGIYRSTDGGANFTVLNGTHADHHAFANDPVNAGVIYDGDDGGIYQSTNRGDSWTFIGEGMANAEFYDMADAATQPNLVIGGMQDNSDIKYDGSTTVWQQFGPYGDGATVDIDSTNAQIFYFSGQGIESLARSPDSGNSSAVISAGLPAGLGANGCAVYNTHFQVHPSQPTTLLASPAPCGALYRTTNAQPPGSWSAIFSPPSGSIVRSAVDPSVNLYYAGATDGHIYAGPGGANWQAVFAQPNGLTVSDIEVDAEDPATVYAAFAGGGVGRVYRLRRSSAAPTSMTATDITSDLPTGLTIGIAIDGTTFTSAGGGDLAVDRLLPLTIYVGTMRGVYCGRSDDGGNTWFWTPYNNGMPATNVTDLEVHPTTGVMRAVTFGRSAFEVNTDDPIGSLLGAEGKVTLLRVHDEGTGYGPPTDFIDVEVVIWLDSMPSRAFGFQLRDDDKKAVGRGMLNLLREAFNSGRSVHIDYVRTGFRNGLIARVMFIP